MSVKNGGETALTSALSGRGSTQNVAHVNVDVHSQVHGCRGGTMAEPGDPRLLEKFLVSRARDHALLTVGHGLKIAPSTVYFLDLLLNLGSRAEPRHVWTAR
jgi:hypothetical protein